MFDEIIFLCVIVFICFCLWVVIEAVIQYENSFKPAWTVIKPKRYKMLHSHNLYYLWRYGGNELNNKSYLICENLEP